MTMASSLVVLMFDTPEGAEQGLTLAVNLQKQHRFEIEDAATVTWPRGKKNPKTRHAWEACTGAWYGTFWNMLFTWIFILPFVSAALTSAADALNNYFADFGIGHDFVQKVRGKVTEGTSALFLVVGPVTTDRVVEAFKGAPKFEVIATNLSQEQEDKLKAAFAH
jgi:uncharacterized membrane protein